MVVLGRLSYYYASAVPRRSDSRELMIRTAARLFRRQGYAATGWRQVVGESDTPWGSQAHHFPGGKEQLAIEALAGAGERYRRMLTSALEGTHPADMVAGWSQVAAAGLTSSGWADGCPIATVSLETAHLSEALGATCDVALKTWIATIADAIVSRGLDRDEAASLATVVVAGIEGALLLARTSRSGEPLLTVGHELATLLRTRVP
jgi:TetR/AcrR family transcriptional regulator, lmrAB and yxaGH operons repressor